MVADQRRDSIHKLTADAGFGEIRRQLEYRTAWRGGTLTACGTVLDRDVNAAVPPHGESAA